MKKKRLCIKETSQGELIKYYDDYCKRKKIDKNNPKATSVWWAMFYTWKECGEWIEYEEDYLT